MERVTDHQFALIDGKVRHLPGGVDEYLKLAEEADREAAKSAGGGRGNDSGAVSYTHLVERWQASPYPICSEKLIASGRRSGA